MQKKAAIFDFDGLMFDTETSYFNALCEVASHFGKEMTKEVMFNQMGISGPEMVEALRQDLSLKYSMNEIHEVVKNKFRSIRLEKIEPMPGLFELLNRLEQSEIIMAVCSSNVQRIIRKMLEMHSILDKFEIIISSEEVENRKPFPDPYIKVVRNLGLNADECLVLEDSAVGVQSARAANLDCIAIPTQWTEMQDFSHATAVATALNDDIVLKYFK